MSCIGGPGYAETFIQWTHADGFEVFAAQQMLAFSGYGGRVAALQQHGKPDLRCEFRLRSFGLLDRGRHLRHRHQRARYLVEIKIRNLLLRERSTQERDERAVPQLLSQIAGSGIAGDFVMLDPLRRSNEREVSRSILLLLAFLHDFLALLN